MLWHSISIRQSVNIQGNTIYLYMYALLWMWILYSHTFSLNWILQNIHTHTYSHTSINNSQALQSNSQKQSINRERAQKTYAIPEERRRSLYILRSTVRHQSPPNHTHSFVYVKRRLWSLLGHTLLIHVHCMCTYMYTSCVVQWTSCCDITNIIMYTVLGGCLINWKMSYGQYKFHCLFIQMWWMNSLRFICGKKN